MKIDFVIIGVAKSATTWLTECLMSHPDIYIPRDEIHFFSNFYEEGINWYHNFYKSKADENLILGDNSKSYLYNKDVAMRIKNYNSNMKIIAILRNPIERAYSDYCMHYRKGDVDKNIKKHLDPDIINEDNLFLKQGLYYKNLKPYFKLFPEKQIKILIFDDLVVSDNKFLREVLKFLSVDIEIAQKILKNEVNTRDEKKVPPLILKLIRPILYKSKKNQNIIFKFLHSKFGKEIKEKVKGFLRFKKFKYPELDKELKLKLIDYYSSDIKKLSNILDRDLTHWLQI